MNYLANKFIKFKLSNSSKATFYYFTSVSIVKSLSFLNIFLLARFIPLTDYGIYNTLLTWIPISALIIGLSLSSSVKRGYLDFYNKFDEFINSLITLIVFVFLFFIFSFSLFSQIFPNRFNYIYVYFIFIHGLFVSIQNIIFSKNVMLSKSIANLIIQVTPNLIFTILLLILIFIRFEFSINTLIILSLFPTLLMLSIFFLNYVKTFSKNFFKYWKYSLKISIPLIFHGIFLSLLSNFDRTLLILLRNPSDSAIYSVIYTLAMSGQIIISSIENVWITFFLKNMNKNNYHLINLYSRIYVYISFLIHVGIMMILPEIIKILLPDPYLDGIYIVPILVFSSLFLFSYALYVNLIYFYKKNSYISLNTFVTFLFNLLFNLFLIPSFGIFGSTVATLLSYILLFILNYSVAVKFNKLVYSIWNIITSLLLFIFFIIIYYGLINFFILRILTFVFFFVIIFYLNRNSIFKILFTFK